MILETFLKHSYRTEERYFDMYSQQVRKSKKIQYTLPKTF